MNTVISIKGIGKKYNIAHKRRGYLALRDVIGSVMRKPIAHAKSKLGPIFGRESKEIFWALQDISFEVAKGEVVGIIGKNGAGKSTLLKILTGITPPTTGEIKIKGKVASLLEVGTGFHPELTGRENIYLNGAILGMKRTEISKKFDQIVEFSGIEKFLDTPVKRYSSGMYVRLAFSVAAHLEPDILLVDEVLAVGDAEFQKKCLGKMDEVTKAAGRTIIFVSHNMSAVEKLCPKTILLSRGQMVKVGQTKSVIEEYLREGLHTASEHEKVFPFTEQDIVVHHFKVKKDGIPSTNLDADTPFDIEIDFETLSDLTLFRTGVYIRNSLGDILVRSFIADWHPELEKIKKGRYAARLTFPERLLTPGHYFISLSASRFGMVNYLEKHHLEIAVTVGPSAYFNQAHPTERPEARILIKNDWRITPIA